MDSSLHTQGSTDDTSNYEDPSDIYQEVDPGAPPTCEDISDTNMNNVLAALGDLGNPSAETADAQVPLSDLWNGRPSDCVFEFSQQLEPATDYYAELLASLERGKEIFHTPLPASQSTLGEELPCNVDGANKSEEQDDFGIEMPETDFEQYAKDTQVTLEVQSYPWPYMAMFLTDLLFSSPRLQFSEQQRTAVLTWGKELGAHNVPSLCTVKKCQECIKDLVRNPTEKVESHSGTVFYINNVGKTIAKDYANPLT
ncbi:hypothetical protein B0H21DRAFT_823519 [Amylocystis lapponica]|nr:hypothetical protein B0H21DRAFT_823519 [Amylocystis lapponica]